jgi:uncharacterized protein
MIARVAHRQAIEELLAVSPVVAVLGARQVGKSTLARAIAADRPGSAFFDLEDPEDDAMLAAPKLALAERRGLVVLDEVQRRQDLFAVLRVLADRPEAPARFLLLGSASPDLMKHAADSLAGRVAFYELPGLDLEEVGDGSLRQRWLRGGFPRSFLAPSDEESYRWRGDFVRTFLERDLPALGLRVAPDALRRFWSMLAHYHAQTWNGAELARALAVSEGTVRHYLDLLVGTFVVRRLQPWHENAGKRVVKSPKVYIADTGLLHRLLQIPRADDLLGHPKVGASWEGFAIDAVVRRLRARADEAWFWGLHSGAELDLLVVRGRRRLGFEMKLTDAPSMTPSIRAALAALDLERIDVVHAGSATFPLSERVRALSLARLGADLDPL